MEQDSPWHFWLSVSLNLILAGLLLVVPRSAWLLGIIGAQNCIWRMIFIMFFLMEIDAIWALGITPYRITQVGMDLMVMSWHYFAACRPPKPPKRRHALKPATELG